MEYDIEDLFNPDYIQLTTRPMDLTCMAPFSTGA